MTGSFVAQMKKGRFIVVSLVTVVAFSFLVKLGFWQLSRAEEKSEIEQHVLLKSEQIPIRLEALASDALDNPTGTKVVVSATPVIDKYLLLDNQNFNGNVGYLALQLVKSDGGRWLLVERGFVEAPALRSELPKVVWLTEPMSIEGRLYRKSTNPLSQSLYLEPGVPSRIQNLNFSQLEAHWEVPLENYVLQPQSKSWPYPQPWSPVSMKSEKHLGYAVQWFSMAGALAVLSLILLVRIFKQGAQNE
ncbi:SURF1 family protein [Vibrio sp. RE86]|nr:SURF1 family protein [Vibrio sp. RE86]